MNKIADGFPFDVNNSILLNTVLTCKQKQCEDDAKMILSLMSKHSYSVEVLDEIAYYQSIMLKDYPSAIDTLNHCISISQSEHQQYNIRTNLVNVYNNMNDPENALKHSQKNEKFEKQYKIPDSYNTQLNIAISHYFMGDYQTSEQVLRLILNQPNLPDDIVKRIKYNLATYEMNKGSFKSGYKNLIAGGHSINVWKNDFVSDDIPVLNHKLFKKAKTPLKILVMGEGGIGDEVISIRFMRNLSKLGHDPIFVSNSKHLVPVFNRNGFKCIHRQSDELKNLIESKTIQYQCMAMFLPIILDLDKDQLWDDPYLEPDPIYVEKWKNILPNDRLLGVKWYGNREYDQDLHRSIPFELINTLEWNGTKVNLQLEESIDGFFNAGEYIEDLEDTLAILSLIDNLVSSCTSIIHLMGALGKTGIVCPPIASYFVWDRSKTKSDWYSDSIKVYCQKNHKNWLDVMLNVQIELNQNP